MHEAILRGVPQVVDVVEGTYKYFKIETKGLLSPLKLTFKMHKEDSKDFRIMYSLLNARPDEETSDRVIDQPSCIIIRSFDDRVFTREYIYFKFQSQFGAHG